MSVQLDYQRHYARVRTRLWKAAQREKVAAKPVLTVVKARPAYLYIHPIGPRIPVGPVFLTLEHFGKPGSVAFAKRLRKAIADKHGISVNDIMSIRRTGNLVAARYELYWNLKKETKWSLPQIGRFLERDHTTILHGIRRYEAMLKWQANVDEAQGPDYPVFGTEQVLV